MLGGKILLLVFYSAVIVRTQIANSDTLNNQGVNNMRIPWDLKWWNHGTYADKDKSQVESGAEHWLKRQTAESPTFEEESMRVASKQAELQTLLQQIYQAEAAVKMETSEVTRIQQAALEAEQALEEATNKVRMISNDLQNAQEAAAQAAMRAHTAQLQLSAHDQLMFTARQRVDTLSAKLVSVQAELASAQHLFPLSNSTMNLDPSHVLQMNPEGGELVSYINDQIPQYPQNFYPPQDMLPSIYQNKYPWMVPGASQYAQPPIPDASIRPIPYVFKK